MAFDDFIAGFTNADLQDLAGFIRRNEVSADLEAELVDEFEAVPLGALQDAFEEKAAILDVLVALGLGDRFEFPDGEVAPPPEGLVEEAENGLEVDEEPPAPSPQPRPGQREPATQGGRPSPFGNNVDKEIARRFFGGNLMKAQAWVSAEQERLSRFQGLEPDEFWSQFGAGVWGADLTRQEFLNPSMD